MAGDMMPALATSRCSGSRRRLKSAQKRRTLRTQAIHCSCVRQCADYIHDEGAAGWLQHKLVTPMVVQTSQHTKHTNWWPQCMA